MIQRHRALGYEVTTDVFDLQLFGIQSASVALPLAAALRDALARKLGVEDAEMGISASETKAEDGVGRWSVLIYDKAPGGAGFSISAGIHIEDLLKDAAEILDCPNGANCTKGCPECVMCRDLEAHEQIIHRIEAFRFIRELVQQLGLPQDLAVFGPETRPESQPLVDAIMREIERDHEAELRINLFGQPGDWDLARWPVLRAAHRLASRGRCVRIVMDSSVPAKLDHASRIELYGLVIKAGCNLDIGATAQTIADHAVLASVGLGADRIAWATRDARAIQANDTWSRVGKEIIVRGIWMGGGAPVRAIDQNKFFAETERTALCSLTTELNGRIEDFGEAFWRFVGERSPLIGRRLAQKTPLLSIEYSDRYLNSPLPVRLLAEVVAHAPGLSSPSVVKLITPDQVSNYSSASPTLFKHDWQVLKHRDDVLQGGLSGTLGNRFTLSRKPKFDVPHGRILRLKFADGGVAILLDQGFGYWWPTRAIRFDFSATVAEQIRELRTCPFQLQSSQGYATWIGVKED
jgi:hypothetical protein